MQPRESADSAAVDGAARTVYEYMRMGHQLRPSDAIVCLGSSDLRVAAYAAELFARGLAPLLVFSGGVGTGPHSGRNLLGWERSEAEVMAEEAARCGVPREAMLLECDSSNSGENIRFVHALLQQRRAHEPELPAVARMIVVQKPFMERRAFAAFMKQWPEEAGARPVIAVASPPLSWDEYPLGTPISVADIIAIMVGDLQRLKRYAEPPTEYQIAQDIPSDVWSAGVQLAGLGFTANLLPDTPEGAL